MGSMVLHTIESLGAELTELLACGVAAGMQTTTAQPESYTQQCTAYRSIE
jgi:hypothetical protein